MNKTLILLLAVIMTACGSVKTTSRQVADSQDQLILATLWYQKSAEMEALYLQCFLNAERALVENISQAAAGKPLAVVMDIDETVLDNSPYQGWQIIENRKFNESDWNRWVQMAKAEPLPGAVGFTRFADSLGVEVFYISNRDANAVEPTVKNMEKAGFSFADHQHMLFKETSSSKVSRRETVEKTHQIILLIGDNLADLDAVFEKRPEKLGISDVNSRKNMFGTRYIILPNPMYGTWLSEILKQSEGTSEREKLLRQTEGF